MATDTAPPGAPPARRHYWQLPTFALGVAAAAAAWAAFPPRPDGPADRFARDVAALKQALDRRPVDGAAAESLAPAVAAELDQISDPDPAVRFLVGSGFLVAAERSPGDADLWALAAQHLGRVDPDQLSDPQDGKRLLFRRAKADAATGRGDPTALVAALLAAPPGDEPEGERRRLLADSCLRLDPPDLKRAADELGKYLAGPVRLPPAVAGRYWLTLAGVQAGLNRPDDARKCLKEIGPTAPPDVQAAAKAQLARLAAAENNWAEAVKLFEAALAGPKLPADQAAVMRYQTGVGYVQLRNPTAAVPFFEQAAKENGPVAAAAATRLAEFALRDPARKGARSAAVDSLEAAARGATPGAEFRNPYLSANDFRAAFEEAVQVCAAEGDFPSAVRAATAYGAVAAAGRDREKRAEVTAQWAAALARTPAGAADAAAKFQAAAADYAAIAADYPTPAGRADLLRRAATCFKQAGDDRAAAAVLDTLTTAAGLPADVVAAAWVEKADTLLTSDRFPEAVDALKKALAAPGPAAASARVKLALAYLDRGRTLARTASTAPARDEAAGMLEFGRRELAQAANAPADTPVERDAHELALFELGKLLLGQGNLPDAEARFRQQVQSYPAGPHADQGRLFLGSCLLVLARGDHQGGRPPADADAKLAEAAKLFETLSATSDPHLRTQADLRLANALLLQKRYDELPAVCDKLAARYAGKVQELILLSMRYHAEAFADRKADAARTRARMREVYDKLTDADFPGGMDEYTRQHWETHWFAPAKPRPGS